MDGIINVLKPPGMTSHDVVSFIRRKLNISKVGHTGTLDPGVPGVLPICVGKATRVAEYLTQGTKSYRGIVKFGIETDSQDSFGAVRGVVDAFGLTEKDITVAFESFVGEIKQIPPMFSAVKIKGKKLYELAREGKEIVRESRDAVIYSLKIIRFMNLGQRHPEVMFDVRCSKGTYIRTLCHDIGQTVGTGAHMSFLVRTLSGNNELKDAYTLDEISALVENNRVGGILLPIESALMSMPVVWVRESAIKSICNGSRLYPQGVERVEVTVDEGTLVRLKTREGTLLVVAEACYEKTEDNGQRLVYKPVKVFC